MKMKRYCVVLCSAVVFATSAAEARGDKEKAEICHKWRTIEVSDNAVDRHLAHGDYVGECDPCNPPVDGDGKVTICKKGKTKRVKPERACRYVEQGKAEFGACDSCERGGCDSDGDGVFDRDDLCPDTPQGDDVYDDGCTVILLEALAGPDITATEGDTVHVVGQGRVLSGNCDESNLVYEWSQIAGDPVNFTAHSPPVDIDTTGAQGELAFRLTVSTEDGVATASDDFAIMLEASLCEATIIDLGTLPGKEGASLNVGGINDAGQVVGRSGNAYLWQDGVMTDLGTAGGSASQALAINEYGFVTGFVKVPQNHAAMFDGGAIDLGFVDGQCGGCNSIMCDVNDDEDMVGHAEFTSPSHVLRPVLRRVDGTVEFLDIDGFSGGIARGINSAGDIAIVADNCDAYDTGKTGSGFISHADGSVTTLGQLGGYAYCYPRDISDSGYATGYASNSPSLTRAFLWLDGEMTDIGTLGGSSQAFHVNEAGHAVGKSNGRAFIYRGTMTDLNDLLPEASGWTLQSANDINNVGQVVGIGLHGGQKRVFLMTLCD